MGEHGPDFLPPPPTPGRPDAAPMPPPVPVPDDGRATGQPWGTGQAGNFEQPWNPGPAWNPGQAWGSSQPSATGEPWNPGQAGAPGLGPTPAPDQQPASSQPPAPMMAAGSGQPGSPPGEHPRPQPTLGAPWVPAGLPVLAVVLGIALLVWLAFVLNPAPHDVPTKRASPPGIAPDAHTLWHVDIKTLRPDLHDPQLRSAPDADFDENTVIDAGDEWVVLTDDGSGHSTQAVAFAPDTGAIRWRHPLADGGMCAASLLRGHLVCLSPTRTDANGLGTVWSVEQWRLDTGAAVGRATVAGWFCDVHVVADRILLAEQILPAPHAALRALTPSFQQAWRIDLASTPEQRLMFSHNRITIGRSGYPTGLALDRLRLRTLRPRLAVMWAGEASLFVDPTTGQRAGLFHCTRPQDDGVRIWCNNGDHAEARVLAGGQLKDSVRTPTDVRLTFPDPVASPRPALFEDAHGLVGVDPVTGKRTGRGVQLAPIMAFGQPLSPQYTAAGALIVAESGDASSQEGHMVTVVDPTTMNPVWSRPDTDATGGAVVWQGHLLIGGSELLTCDLHSGAVLRHNHAPFGTLAVIDKALVVVGYDEITRLSGT